MKVTVIGLGPAGAMAAYQLARRGFNVEGIDIQKRYVKACGDALTIRPAYQGIVEESGSMVTRISEFTIMIEGYSVYDASIKPAPWYIVDKSRLVGFLRDLALAEGARLRLGTIARIKRAENVTVDARGPLAHEPIGEKHVIVYRGISKVRGWDPSHVILDFLPSRAGLYWVFPADDSGRLVNFGSGFWGGSFAEARKYSLDRLRRDLGEPVIIDEKGAPIAVWAPIELSGNGRLRVGEAAGLVNSLSGEGNRYALLSGMLVAEAIGRNPEAPGAVYWRLASRLAAEARLSRLLLSLVAALGSRGRTLLEGLPGWFWKEYLTGRVSLDTITKLLASNPGTLAPLLFKSRLSS